MPARGNVYIKIIIDDTLKHNQKAIVSELFYGLNSIKSH
jgi:hypothetical protein